MLNNTTTMTLNYKYVWTILLLCILMFGCKTNKTSKELDRFTLYTTIEELDTISGSIIVVPKIDRYIFLPKELSLYQKIDNLLDSITNNSFNNLLIEILELDINKQGYKSLKVNFKEFPGFTIPNSLGKKYQTWYDYFQGSTGGRHTTVVLIESILQNDYMGDWINEVEFYYQNEKIGEWDHISISEPVVRE